MALIAAALTFGIVFYAVWKLGQGWIHASEVKGAATPDGGSGARGYFSNGAAVTWKYVIGADGRVRLYTD